MIRFRPMAPSELADVCETAQKVWDRVFEVDVVGQAFHLFSSSLKTKLNLDHWSAQARRYFTGKGEAPVIPKEVRVIQVVFFNRKGGPLACGYLPKRWLSHTPQCIPMFDFGFTWEGGDPLSTIELVDSRMVCLDDALGDMFKRGAVMDARVGMEYLRKFD